MEPYGNWNLKTLLLPQITFQSFETFFLNILLSGPHKSTVLDFWNVQFLIIHDFLALPEYVSRIKIRPSSVRDIDYLWTYCMDFFQILVLASPGPYALTFFDLKKNKQKENNKYF